MRVRDLCKPGHERTKEIGKESAANDIKRNKMQCEKQYKTLAERKNLITQNNSITQKLKKNGKRKSSLNLCPE